MTDRETIPALPTLSDLTEQLRSTNRDWSHPDLGGAGNVSLILLYVPRRWVLDDPDLYSDGFVKFGHEPVPGTDDFDATAAARRLLSDARTELRNV